MYIINVKWIGGPEWDNTAPSMFNPTKKKSATEHLIETGGQSIDEAIMGFDMFKSAPIKVEQFKQPGVNWITSLAIEESDPVVAEDLKNQLTEHYAKKQKQLETDPSGYKIEIEVVNQ